MNVLHLTLCNIQVSGDFFNYIYTYLIMFCNHTYIKTHTSFPSTTIFFLNTLLQVSKAIGPDAWSHLIRQVDDMTFQQLGLLRRKFLLLLSYCIVLRSSSTLLVFHCTHLFIRKHIHRKDLNLIFGTTKNININNQNCNL